MRHKWSVQPFWELAWLAREKPAVKVTPPPPPGQGGLQEGGGGL